MSDLSSLFSSASSETVATEVTLRGDNGTSIVVGATLKPRGLSLRTRSDLAKSAVAMRNLDEENGEEMLDAFALFDKATTNAIVEQVESWDLTVDGEQLPVDDVADLPIEYRTVILTGVTEAVSALPLDGKPKQSEKPSNTAKKRRHK